MTDSVQLDSLAQSQLTFGVGIPCPEPGYYPGVPQDVYLRWDACSKGKLQEIRRSPAHLKSNVIMGSGETDALRYGSAQHMAILEPEIFGERYKPKSRCVALTGKGKGPRCESNGKYLLASGDMVCGTHVGDQPLNETVTLIDQDQYAACRAARANVSSKRRAANLVGAAGDFEISIVWDEQVEVLIGGELVTVPLRMKGRLDHYSPDLDRGTILDLKTTEDASEEQFLRSIYKYSYHMQGGLYVRGCKALGLPAQHFVILALEKKPPYEVGVFRLTSGALDAGEELALKWMKLYARCKHLDDWPGYPDRVREIALPDWAWKATDDELQRAEEAWQI